MLKEEADELQDGEVTDLPGLAVGWFETEVDAVVLQGDDAVIGQGDAACLPQLQRRQVDQSRNRELLESCQGFLGHQESCVLGIAPGIACRADAAAGHQLVVVPEGRLGA